MSLRRLSINASAATAQTLVVTVVLIGLYSLMVRVLGVERVGLWSLVMSIVAIGKIGEAGLGTTLMRFTAQDLGSKAFDRVRPTLLSCGLIVLGATTGLALLLSPTLLWVLGRLIDDDVLLDQARLLLPFALLVMIQTALANLLFGMVDAFQRTYLRSIAVSLAGVIQLGAAFWLIPSYGLLGVAWLQVGHAAIMVLAGAGLVAWLLNRTEGRWGLLSRQRLWEVLRFGGGLQINTVAQLFFEPCTKALITAFGGLTMTGYFEVASRAVMQLRSLVVTAFQMLVPYIAGRFPTAGESPQEVINPYRRSLLLMQAIVCLGAPVLLAMFPIIFAIWLQQVDDALLAIAVLCTLGWGLNMLTVPAYLFALAMGKVRWTVESHVIIGILTPVLASLGGWLAGGPGVAAGAMLSLVIGSMSAVFRLAGSLKSPTWPKLSTGLWAIAAINLTLLAVWSVSGADQWAELLHWPALQAPLFNHLTLPVGSGISALVVTAIATIGWLWLTKAYGLWQRIVSA